MKPLHKINTWALAINVILFIIPWFGMLAMIPLGILQLLTAAGISLTYYRHLDKKNQKLIKLYWLFVIIDFSGIAATKYYDPNYNNDFFSSLFLFVFPGFIAFYFVYTSYCITRYLNH